MGTWGTKAYENDSAADWFGDLWEEFAVPQKVEQTLRLSLHDHHEEIRAAAYFLIQMGDVYQWPVEDIDRHCHLAAFRLQQMLNTDLFEDHEDFKAQMRDEIAILQSRISQDYQPPADPLAAKPSAGTKPPAASGAGGSYSTKREPFYFITASPLIERFRDGTFHDALAAPYFVLYMVLNSIAFLFSSNATSWDTASDIASVFTTFLGLLYLKHKNGRTFGDQFFAKFFTLGWIVAVRMLLFLGLLFIVLTFITLPEMDAQTEGLVWLCTGIAFEIYYFWWLGSLMAKTQPAQPTPLHQ